MKIAIDICRIEDFGVGTYIQNLIKTLASRDSGNQYLLLGDASNPAVVGLPANFETAPWDSPQPTWKQHLRLHRLLRARGVDVFHIPYIRAAALVPCSYLITVHDVAQFIYDAESGFRQSMRWRMIRRALMGAYRVLAVSNSTMKEIETLFAIPAEKIQVVGNAIDERFTQTSSVDERSRVLERYQVNYPYLLYVGSARPQKNVPRLIEAFAVVKNELRDHPLLHRLRLVIIGDQISEHSDLRRAVVRTRMQSEVRFLGFVPAATLRVFYKSAEVFVFPSLHEGFGLPPLEAMAQGTPVVTSNVSSLPEVVGDAAVMVNPENVFEIARGISHVLLDDELREQLRCRGRANLARFSWQRSVDQVLALYAEAGA